MGVLFKYILILIVVLYLINKVGKFFYELFLGSTKESRQNQSRFSTSSQSSERTNDIHVEPKNSQNSKNFKAGEYVDYEEID